MQATSSPLLFRVEGWLRSLYKFLVWIPVVWIGLFLTLILRVKLADEAFHFQNDTQLPYDAQVLGVVSFFGFFLALGSVVYVSLPLTLYLLLRKQGPALKWHILVLLLGIISCLCLMRSAWFERLVD